MHCDHLAGLAQALLPRDLRSYLLLLQLSHAVENLVVQVRRSCSQAQVKHILR